MSHFTRVKTQLTDIQMVKRVLEDLGHTVTSGIVRGYGNQETRADLVVRLDDRVDVGFQQDGKVVGMIGDFYGSHISPEAFLNKVSQRYAYLTILDQTTDQGWQKVTEETQADGSVRLVLQRWA
jgi:hypothetical protein